MPTATPSTEPRAAARWFVLRTRSRQELILANELRAMGVDHCLLLVNRRRDFGGWEAAVRVPLFPQCLFLRGAPLDAEFARHTHRVTDLVEVADADRLAKELDAVCAAVDSGAPCEVGTIPPDAVPARVTRGPLTDVEGFVERHANPRQLFLPLTCIGEAVAVEMDPSLLAVASVGKL